MDAEQARKFLRKLPLVVETTQWGNNLVFWVGDKAVGGKMFALINLDLDGKAVMSFSASPQNFHELLENDGVIPAPYMARIRWIALERWNALAGKELQDLLSEARDLTYAKMPKRVKDALALPAAEFATLLRAKKQHLLEKQMRESAAKVAAMAARKKSPKKRTSTPVSRPR